MTRSVSVRVGVALAVVLSVLAASVGPVGAMHTQAVDGLVVGSQHDTQAEFQNAQQLTNLTTTSSGDGAVKLPDSGLSYAEGFENQPADSGVPDGWEVALAGPPNTINVTTKQAASGTQSTYINTGSTYEIRPGEQPYGTAKTDDVSVSVFDPGSASLQAGLALYESGTRLGVIGMHNGDLAVFNGSWQTISTAADPGEWVSVTVTQIDPSTDTFAVEWSTSSQSGTQTGLGMENPASNGYTSAVVRTVGDGYYDDYRIGGGTLESATYISPLHAVSGAEQAAINITQASNVSITPRIVGYDESGTEVTDYTFGDITTTGNHTLDFGATWDDAVSVETRLYIEVTGSNPQFSLADESILFTPHAPQASGFQPADNTTRSTLETTLSLNVTDADFQTVQGDTVDVTFFVNGDEVEQSTLASSGTANTTVTTLGKTSWYAVLEDEYGQTVQTATRTFTTPNTLHILNELHPEELVNDNVSVTVRAYAGDTALSRTTKDGTVNLTGFPMNQPVVITTNAEGWVERRIIIEDLTEQQRIYLLNESADTIPVTFQLSDKTGSFPPESSRLAIEKALNVTGSEDLEWVTITGDYFAADLKFPTTLVHNHRYRIVIQNAQGDQRILGSYIPYAATTTTLSIGQIVWDIPETNGVYSTSRIDDQGRLEVLYNDTAGVTTRLNITAWNRSTGDVVYSAIEYDVQQSVTSVPVTSEDIVVSVYASREGAPDYNSTGLVGRPNIEQGTGFEMWIRLGSQVLLLGIAGLVVGQMPKKGGLVVVALAFGVTWLGFWQIHPASLGLAGVLAIVSATNRRGF